MGGFIGASVSEAVHTWIYIHIIHISQVQNTMDMKLDTGITQTNKAGRQYKAKQTL
jgi:hypothetical protein